MFISSSYREYWLPLVLCQMGIADAIVDLVSSGTTLRENNLKEIEGGVILESQVTKAPSCSEMPKFATSMQLDPISRMLLLLVSSKSFPGLL